MRLITSERGWGEADRKQRGWGEADLRKIRCHSLAVGSKGEDAYSIRVGDYRIIYEINDYTIIVTVVSVGHRKDIYK